MKQAVVEAAEVTIRTKPGRRTQREEWWWSEEVRQALKEKKRSFKRWRKSGLEADKEKYNAKKKEAKKAVAVAKKEGTATLYEDLDTREGEIKIYRIAKARQREREGTGNVNIIKNSEGKVVFKQEEVGEVWAEYFEELLNVENERGQLQVVDPVKNPVLEITKEEVERAVRKMKSNKVRGVSEVSIDMVKAGGEEEIQWMWEVLREVWRLERIPDEWTRSVIVPIFKNKGDILDCKQYRGIKLLERGLKVLERVLDERVRKLTEVDPRQFGFMPGKSTVDAIFIARQLMEKGIEGNLESYWGFVDLEKAYGRVPREVIYWSLRRKGVPEKLVRLIQETYRNTKSAVRTETNSSREFNISVGLHQGSALSPLLFAIIVDELTMELREEMWELLFASLSQRWIHFLRRLEDCGKTK